MCLSQVDSVKDVLSQLPSENLALIRVIVELLKQVSKFCIMIVSVWHVCVCTCVRVQVLCVHTAHYIEKLTKYSCAFAKGSCVPVHVCQFMKM